MVNGALSTHGERVLPFNPPEFFLGFCQVHIFSFLFCCGVA